MLRSMNSSDTHDDHLRHLLDQRATRANHGHFPSLSELSDSPSVYSHAYFSPRPLDKAELDAQANTFNFEVPSHHRQPTSEPRSPMSDRERLDDPSASSLDLADDPRSSYDSSDVYTQTEHLHNHAEAEAEEEDDSMLRMSMLGPKMRFHSLAPWETDEDSVLEEDESDSGNSKPPSIFHRGRNNMSKKGFALGSSNPRASSASRPSGESSRSQPKSKKSFEATMPASTGALHTHTQASLSSASLVTPLPSPGQSTGRSKISTGRTPSRTPSHYGPSSPASPHPPVSSSPRSPHFHYHVSTPSPRDTVGSSPRSNLSHTDALVPPPGRSSTSSSRSDDDFIHPYANPDLVVSYTPSPIPQSPHRMVFPSSVTRSDSTATVTDSLAVSSTRSVSITLLTPDPPSVSKPDREQNMRSGISSFQGKEISSPIPVTHTGLRPSTPTSSLDGNGRKVKPPSLQPQSTAINSFPGWQDNPKSPTLTLISLQEAQALARERSRSVTAHASGVASSAPPAPISIPETDQTSISGIGNSPLGRARARSISTGARAKHALHNIVAGPVLPRPERRDSEPSTVPQQPQYTQNNGPPAKSLKHKKSGFMRIFNGREKEKERDRDRTPPPPLPLLSDAYTAYSSIIPSQPKTPKTPRIPVPQLSPTLLEDSSSQGSYLVADFSSNSLGARSVDSHRNDPSTKRTPPPLHILTQPRRSSPDRIDAPPPMHQNRLGPSPQSAPPGRTDFPALSLRPVSTLFSAHFAEHIVTHEHGALPDQDPDTFSPASPRTSGNSPLTPGFPSRNDLNLERTSVGVDSQDQSSVIQALQDQIMSARKAWQRQIWELEGQVRDLKAEVEGLRASGNDKDYCEACGRGKAAHSVDDTGNGDEIKKTGIVNRPRARTGGGTARFGSGV